jgi:hypothetical protein
LQRYFDQPKPHQAEPCETCKQVHSSKICPGLVVSAECSRYGDNVNRSLSVTHAALSASTQQTDVLEVSCASVAENVATLLETATLQEKCFVISDVRCAIRRDITLSTALYNGGRMSTVHLKDAMLNLNVGALSRRSSSTIQPASQSILKLISQPTLTATFVPRRVI